MGRLLNIVNQLHRRTARDYIGRMGDEKVHCSEVARRFDRDYWDGDRRYGYGGYKYDGRWSVVAKQLVDTYALQRTTRDSRRRLRPRLPAVRVHAAAAEAARSPASTSPSTASRPRRRKSATELFVHRRPGRPARSPTSSSTS